MSTDKPASDTPTSNPPQPTNSNPRGLWTALRNTTFRSLRHRNYRRYFLGQIVSFVGSWMQSAALMWLMYDRTGDPRWPSWLLVAQVGPTLLLGNWGGGLADRYPKRQLILCTQTAFLCHAVLVTLLIGFDLAVPGFLLALMVVSGMIQAVDLPARLAFVPDLVPKEDLINAVALNSLLFNSARAIGPALAGVVFLLATAALPWFPPNTSSVTVGAVACFALNAVSFVAVLFALRGIHVPGASKKKTVATSMWDGVRYLRENTALGGLVLLTLVICIFGWPLLTVLPALTRQQLGEDVPTYSMLVSMFGAGAFVAALATATFGTTQRRWKFLVAGGIITSLGLFCVSQALTPMFAAMGCVIAGFGLVMYLSTGQSTLQLAVPDAKRGRVMALWAMTLSGSAPIGHILAGQGVTAFGVEPVLLTMSMGVGLAALALVGILKTRRTGK
ncbi:MAG: MFS transporter [Planctomycetes bacterium]|nr:MFS transporter [Planctomycetota bacterium]